jgi:multisubunit Na+/H+ antiporter MnhG subunit
MRRKIEEIIIDVLLVISKVCNKLAALCDHKAGDIYHRHIADDYYASQKEE